MTSLYKYIPAIRNSLAKERIIKNTASAVKGHLREIESNGETIIKSQELLHAFYRTGIKGCTETRIPATPKSVFNANGKLRISPDQFKRLFLIDRINGMTDAERDDVYNRLAKEEKVSAILKYYQGPCGWTYNPNSWFLIKNTDR